MGEVAEDEDEDEAVHLVSRKGWIFGRCRKCQMTSPWYREMCSEQQIAQGGNIINDTAQPYKTFPGATGGLHSLKGTNI